MSTRDEQTVNGSAESLFRLIDQMEEDTARGFARLRADALTLLQHAVAGERKAADREMGHLPRFQILTHDGSAHGDGRDDPPSKVAS